MQLTSHTDYALRLLIYLLAFGEEEPVSAADIARAYDISANHLSKVAGELARRGWVISRRGRGGGLSLAPEARALSVGDVVRALEHNMDLVECFGAHNTCPIAPVCRLQGALHEARDAFLHVLDQHKLVELGARSDALRSLLSPSDTASSP